VGDLHMLSLIGIGFYLFLISLVVNLLAAWIQRKLAVGSQGT
jgi:phosphate transport system permease protein